MLNAARSYFAAMRFPCFPILFLAAFLTAADSHAQSGTCPTGSAESSLEVNGVRARILNTGGLFWRRSPSVYEVPKGSGLSVLFTANLWIGGMVDGDVRVSGSTYGPWEFWPGPDRDLEPGETCEDRDRMYEITTSDLRALESGESPTKDIVEWPWREGAPVIDGDGDPYNYNLAGGDRPELLGDQSLFWIMHDGGGPHGRFATAPLGVEVHVTAFATSHPDMPELDHTTFYRYRVINRSSQVIENAYLGFFADTDLGSFVDDYVGSDTTLHMMFAYNADNDDEGEYGLAPPAVGFQAMTRPAAEEDGLDDDQDGLVDEPGEMVEMAAYAAYFGGGGPQGDPNVGEHAYNLLRGRWRDGRPFTEGGQGWDFSTKTTPYMYPAMPPHFWSEMNVDQTGKQNAPSDRRGVMSVGPFDLKPGDSTEMLLAVITAFGSDHLDSVVRMKEIAATLLDRSAQSFPQTNASTDIPASPDILVPGQGATQQPVDLTVSWSQDDGGFGYIVELDSDSGFGSPMEWMTWNTSLDVDLAVSTTYHLRVRSRHSGGYGPWSPIRTFHTGQTAKSEHFPLTGIYVVANGAGTLPVPQAASAEWNGFPELYDRPDNGQQVGDGMWLIATDNIGPCLDDRCTSVAAFLERTFGGHPDAARYDWEIRFEQPVDEARSWRLGDFARVMPAPFSVWRTGQDTPDDPSDDVRFIVAWKNGYGGTDDFRLNPLDHRISGGLNDPYTDAVFVFAPDDLTPGSAGYEAWLRDASNGSDPGFREEDAWLRNLVFVNWNGGDVQDGRLTQVKQLMPEPGTIFRIDLPEPVRPILASPGPDETIVADSVRFAWWTWNDQSRRLEVDDDALFGSPEWTFPFAFPGHVVIPTPSHGTWHWRVTDWMGSVSETGRFFVGTALDADRADLPSDMRLDTVYPNPSSEELTVVFSTRRAGPVAIELFDMLGRRTRTMLDTSLPSGQHTVAVPLRGVASGAYLMRLTSAGRMDSKVIQVIH